MHHHSLFLLMAICFSIVLRTPTLYTNLKTNMAPKNDGFQIQNFIFKTHMFFGVQIH